MTQILKHAGVRTFVGGNLGTPLSEGVLQCLAFPPNDPPFHASLLLSPWRMMMLSKSVETQSLLAQKTDQSFFTFEMSSTKPQIHALTSRFWAFGFT